MPPPSILPAPPLRLLRLPVLPPPRPPEVAMSAKDQMRGLGATSVGGAPGEPAPGPPVPALVRPPSMSFLSFSLSLNITVGRNEKQ